jgi:hypothetical protein
VIFKTRQETRNWIKENYQHIVDCYNSQDKSNNWKLPIPVKIKIVKDEF